jgi:hypothetical protein
VLGIRHQMPYRAGLTGNQTPYSSFDEPIPKSIAPYQRSVVSRDSQQQYCEKTCAALIAAVSIPIATAKVVRVQNSTAYLINDLLTPSRIRNLIIKDH